MREQLILVHEKVINSGRIKKFQKLANSYKIDQEFPISCEDNKLALLFPKAILSIETLVENGEMITDIIGKFIENG